MLIEVTKEDILSGVQFSASLCPVARALRRCTGRSWSVMSTSASVVHGDGSLGEAILLPDAATRFVRSFDCNRYAASPVSFVMEVPDAD